MTSPDPTSPITATLRRTRLLDRVDGARLVVLTAPSGYGKATMARQIAEDRSARVVACRLLDADLADSGSSRLLEALVLAFPGLGTQPPVADRTGTARLAYALDDLAGPATVLVEGLHLLEDGGEALLATIADTADASVAVIATTESPPPPATVHRAARGDAVVLDATDLLLDDAECEQLARLLGSERSGPELSERSGGWALAAAAAARTSGPIEDVLTADVLGELGPAARSALSAMGLLSSVPTGALDPGVAGELERFARRHPAFFEVGADRWALRDVLRSHLARATTQDGAPVDPIVTLADRLDRLGHEDDALILLSRAEGCQDLLQARLDTRGVALLQAGRDALIRRLVTEIPAPRRNGSTLVLDAAAGIGLDQIEADDRAGFRVDDAHLAMLAGDERLDGDLRLAVAGLRTEFLRRRGDAGLVTVALDALGSVGAVDATASPAQLIADLHPLGRRGLFHVLYGLGTAAQFSGEPAMIAEGERLADLAFRVAESSGIDIVPLRGQAAYERMLIGLGWPDDALAPLEAGAAALESIGHPEAANLLAELADTHLRCGDPTSAIAVAQAAEDWARRTGNDLALPSAALVRAGAELLRNGPSRGTDGALDAAWRDLVSSQRLRRAQPSVAFRIANAHLDHDDTDRAERWLERGRARIGDLVQSRYQEQFLASVEERIELLRGTTPTPLAAEDDRFAAQPAGQMERWATLAWDALRHGDDRPARHLVARADAELPRPWAQRLGQGPPAERHGPVLRIRLLCPEVRVERDGHTLATPAGHAGRLLALLVIADGVLTVDALIDRLWPDAAPGAARNRLHQVLHRVRRTLDIGADGPLGVTDGVVRLDPTEVSSDVGELRGVDASDREAALRAVGAYEAPLCSAQFAYDDAFDDARWELSRRLDDLAGALLAHDGCRDPEAVATVWDAWSRLPDEGRLGAALADAIERSGDPDRAAEIRRRDQERSARV